MTFLIAFILGGLVAVVGMSVFIVGIAANDVEIEECVGALVLRLQEIAAERDTLAERLQDEETGQMTQLQLYAGAQVLTAVDGPCPRRITRACYVWAHNKAEAVGLMIADAQKEFSEDCYGDHNVALTAVDGVTKTAEEAGQ